MLAFVRRTTPKGLFATTRTLLLHKAGLRSASDLRRFTLRGKCDIPVLGGRKAKTVVLSRLVAGNAEVDRHASMDPIERLAALDPITGLPQQIDPGAFVDRRTREPGEPRDAIAIDRCHKSVRRCGDLADQVPERRRLRRRPLRRDDPLHLGEGRAGLEKLAGALDAGPSGQRGIELEDATGQ